MTGQSGYCSISLWSWSTKAAPESSVLCLCLLCAPTLDLSYVFPESPHKHILIHEAKDAMVTGSLQVIVSFFTEAVSRGSILNWRQ